MNQDSIVLGLVSIIFLVATAEWVAHLVRAKRAAKQRLLANALVAAGWPARGTRFTIEYDGFTGTVIGEYLTLEGKPGAVLQLDGARVVHVYGLNRLKAVP